jgi:TRAP-type mannitol/chloroaromatic compound transport system substrate-binding protein
MTVWDKNSFFYPYLENFVQAVATATQGTLTLQLVQPLDPRSTLTEVSQGKAQMGHGMPLLWESQLPAAPYLMAIPFGLTAQEQWLWLTQENGQALADEIYGTVGCKYFPGGNLGFTGGGWFKTEIEGLNTLERLTIHSSGLGAEVWKAAGATVVTLPPDQFLDSLKQNRIGAVEYVSPSQDLGLKFYQEAPYYYFPGWQRPGTLLDFFIHLETWQTLSPALQGMLESLIISFNQQVYYDQTHRNQQALQHLMTQKGVQLKMFPDSLLLRLESLTGQLLETRLTEKPLVDKLLKALIEFRARQLPWTQRVETGFLGARRWTWTL